MTAPARHGLVLDLDGTLADSLSVMRLAYAGFLGEFGKTGNDAQFDRLNGPPLEEIVVILAEAHGLTPSIDRLLALYKRMIREAYGTVQPNAGAGALLEAAQHQGYMTGVVTSNAADLARDWLDRTGLAGLIDLVVGGGDVAHGKPAPDPYLLALSRSGCAPGRSLAVEDSAMGAQAAMAAGLRTFFLSEGPGATPAGATRIARLSDVTGSLVRPDKAGSIDP